jgi:hypothetical protein
MVHKIFDWSEYETEELQDKLAQLKKGLDVRYPNTPEPDPDELTSIELELIDREEKEKGDPMKKGYFVIQVGFVNNDTYEETTVNYTCAKLPKDMNVWRKSLYDGVHEPQEAKVLGVIVPAEGTHVVCHGNIVETYDPNEGGMPENDGRTNKVGNCPQCGRTLSLEIMNDGEEER